MKVGYLVVLLFLCAMSCAPQEGEEGPAEASQAAAEEARSFDGVYEFVRMDTPEGENTEQHGHMIVFGDYVCHVRALKERQPIVQEDSEQVQQEKAAALFQASSAACGQYTLEGDTLTMSWKTSSDPSVEGNETAFVLTRVEQELLLAPESAPEFKFVYRRIE